MHLEDRQPDSSVAATARLTGTAGQPNAISGGTLQVARSVSSSGDELEDLVRILWVAVQLASNSLVKR